MLEMYDIETEDSFLNYLKRLGSRNMLVYKDRVFTYSDIHLYTLKVRSWISAMDAQKIMITIGNSPFSLSLFFASWTQKLKCIAVNPRFVANELLELVKRSKPNLIIIEPNQYDSLIYRYCYSKNIKLIVVNEKLKNLEYFKNVTIEPFFTKYNNEGITYHISSGTSGLYNFYGHSTNQILRYAYARRFDYGLKKNDISLVSLSFNHAYAFSYQLLTNIAIGSWMILAEGFDARVILKLIEKHKVTALALLPMMYHQLASNFIKYPINHRLRYLSVAGDQPSKSLMNLVKNHFKVPLLNGIGMTEVYGYGQNVKETKIYNKIRLFDDVRIKILPFEDNETRYCLDNLQKNVGEICVSTEMMPSSYKGQWVYTGDYGYIDNNYIYILGRIKDIIVKGGSKISAGELEFYLYKMPEIYQVAVIGKKDDLWGEIICACIVKQKKYMEPSIKKINLFLQNFLAPYKHIDEIFLYPENLPMNASGKVDRGQLRLALENASK